MYIENEEDKGREVNSYSALTLRLIIDINISTECEREERPYTEINNRHQHLNGV
jgi:hypothetical protein